MKNVLHLLFLLLPWPLRRRLLCLCFGYRIDPGARIGLAWVAPGRLVMEEGASIGHLTVCKGLDLLHLRAHASIGRGNWVTGLPAGHPRHFAEENDRESALVVGEHAAITHRHIVDCTNRVTIGPRTTFAGYRSQILTHSIDLARGRQASAPVALGEGCFVGTGVVVLAGSVLPDFSVLGAGSVLTRAHAAPHTLYAGVPAKPAKALDPAGAYFRRPTGFVD